MKLPYHILIAFILLPILGWAQAPEGMNYQAVARDAVGEPLANQAITVVFEIRQGSASGTDVYKESQSLSTNQFGLFTAQIGAGTVLGGAFNTIAWGADSYYLYVEIDGDPMGSSQLLSVPYALYSKQSANGPTGPQGPPGISINWLGSFASAPASPNLNDAYYDSTLGQSFIWDGTSWTIIAQDGTAGAFTAGPGISIISGVISNIGDLDSLNELQTITRTGGMITLSDGGGSVIDSVIDADADPNNERITTFALNATNDSIIIVEAGVGHAFPLSNLNDGDWIRGVGNDIFNNTDSIGIGTTNPKSPLQIGSFMHSFPFSMPGPENYSVHSFNAHPNGGTIKNTTGGFSGITFIGHDNSVPMFGVQLYPTQAAGGDVMSVAPMSFIHLKNKGLGIHVDNPDAGLDIAPKDTAAVILRTSNSGLPSHIFFEDTQNFRVGLRSAPVLTNSYELTLPSSLPSVTGSALVSDALGNLSWAPAPNPIWAKTGNAIHQSTLTDYLGIGTTTPATSFHVFNGPGTGGGAYNNIIDAIVEDNDYAYIEFNAGNFAGITFNDDAASIRAGVMFDYNLDALMFRTGGVDHRMILSEAGRLGIGTTAPEMSLHVNGTDGIMINAAGSANNIGGIAFRNGYTVMTRPFHLGMVSYDLGYASAGFSDGLVISGFDGIAFTTNNNALSNSTLTNVRMVINNAGNVGIGTQTPSSNLHVNGEIKLTSTTGGLYIEDRGGPGFFYRTYVDGGGYKIQYANNTASFRFNGNNLYLGEGFVGGGTRLTVGNSGDGSNAIANAWSVFSDRRFKENIETIQNPIDLIKSLNGVTYFWKESGNKDIGFIAQDVEKVLPEVVYTDKETGYKSMDYARMTPILIEAFKEQQKMIEELLKKQQLLEEEILKLKNQ